MKLSTHSVCENYSMYSQVPSFAQSSVIGELDAGDTARSGDCGEGDRMWVISKDSGQGEVSGRGSGCGRYIGAPVLDSSQYVVSGYGDLIVLL
jgi:hypothetical protein